ncbi:MAG: hypothetical protein OQJ93_07110, partial [Ignavibacteriaceae bacterium]|nr:hypothetical protein [Ignavibacteriaceae bacterium]
MPVQNFHSKSLGRDFSIIYFVKQYITDKETPVAFAPDDRVKQQRLTKSIMPVISSTPEDVKIGGYLREATLDGLNGKTK